jgi:DNA-binding transcriptional ArsR family regulator
MANYEASLNHVFYALSDATRRCVIHQLGAGPATVKTLAEPFDMALPSFMKHITVLENSGLITSKKTGRIRTCQLAPRQLHVAESWISQQHALWEARTDRMVSYIETLKTKEKENGNK